MPKHDWMEAVQLCDKILEDIEELPEQAEEFGEGVSEKVNGIKAWVTEQEYVTPKQMDALNNFERGVSKWKRE